MKDKSYGFDDWENKEISDNKLRGVSRFITPKVLSKFDLEEDEFYDEEE